MFYLAWIDAPEPFSEATHLVQDEEVIWGNRLLVENDIPSMSLTIRIPDHELLAPGRKRWAWVSYRKADGTVVPLFLGWLVGLPEDISGNRCTILLTSKPSDLVAQKEALAAGMRVFPYWDPAFIKPESRTDPDVVMESRTLAWHMSHLYPLTMSTSSLIEGEEGHLNFTSGENVPYDSVRRTFREAPLRRVKMTAEGYWDQYAKGQVDLKVPLLDAAKEAGTDEDGVVTTFHGQGLADDWPKEDTAIGPGWKVGEAIATYVKQTQKVVSLDELPVTWEWTGPIWGGGSGDPILNALRQLDTVPGDAIFYLWHLIPHFIAKYEITRRRSEILTFTLEADIQPIDTEPGEAEELEITVTAPDLTEPVDEGGLMPIRNVKRRQYFPTARGRQSIEYLMAVAASRIIARARCVEVEFTVPFEDGIDITCKHSATLIDPRFPGGATGKVIGSSLLIDPERGEFSCHVILACSAGEGNSVASTLGEALYIDDEYIDESYYVREGETYEAVDSHLTYSEVIAFEDNDDGVDFFNMSAKRVVVSCQFVNGETAQRAVLDQHYETIAAAADALIEVPSEYRLVLVPLAGEFQAKYNLDVSGLMVDKTIDLRAVAV